MTRACHTAQDTQKALACHRETDTQRDRAPHEAEQLENCMPARRPQLYHVWVGMRERCKNIRHHAYKKYGGRGITVCLQWENYAVFAADVGPRPGPEYSIHRIDNDLGYFPENVCWATRKEQQQNRQPRSEWDIKYKRIDQFSDEEIDMELARRHLAERYK